MLLTAGEVLTGSELLQPGWVEVADGVVVAAGAGLSLIQSDFGSCAVMVGIGFVVLFLAGAPLFPLITVAGIGGAFGALLVALRPDKFVRITSFFELYETVTGLEVWTADPLTSAGTVGAAAATLDPEDPLAFEVKDWSVTNQGIFGAMRTQKLLISIVLYVIVVVAAFMIIGASRGTNPNSGRSAASGTSATRNRPGLSSMTAAR